MKLPTEFIQLPLAFDAQRLAAEIGALDASLWRPHPTGFEGNTALPLVAVDGDPTRGNALRGRMRATPALDRCPYVQQVFASLDAVIGRVRLMRLAPGAEVTAHVDTNHYWKERVRVHVPIQSHPSVQFFCGDQQLHMAEGECWIFDTWKLHRVTNPSAFPRTHLVIDTVGSGAFARLVDAGRPYTRPPGNWTPRLVVPAPGHASALDTLRFESLNLMSPMSYWELREHVEFLVAECDPTPLLPVFRHYANEFVINWRTLWFQFGSDPDGTTEYRELLMAFLAHVRQLDASVTLRNGAPLMAAVSGLIGEAAGAAPGNQGGEEATRAMPRGGSARAPNGDFDRPVFIVSPPRSGSSLLFETLARSPDACTIGGESHGIIEGATAHGILGAAARGYESNRLVAADATPDVIAALRARFRQRAIDRDGKCVSGRVRLLEKTPKNALRVPFLATVFPDARFVYLYRDPREVLASMLEAWESGGFRTYPQLPDWTGLPWSLVLTPGWRHLVGKPLPEIVANQWQVVTNILLDDLEALPDDRRLVARYDRLLADPNAEIGRLCVAADLRWDTRLDPELPIADHTVSRPAAGKWRARAAEVDPLLPSIRGTMERAERFARADANGAGGR